MSACLRFAIALLATAALTPIVRQLATRSGFLDQPTEQRFHHRSVPLGGGVALLTGIVLAVLGAALVTGGQLPGWRLMAGLALIAALGLVDDLRGVPPAIKLIIYGIVGGLLVIGGDFAAAAPLGPATMPVAVLWVVGLLNACNFLDNMDGVLAGVAAVCALAGWWLAVALGMPMVAILAASVAGAALGFLLHNFPPARIFMGDTGSLVLGFLLAAISLDLITAAPSPPPLPLLLGILLVLGYPLFDITFVNITRISDRRAEFIRGGRDHSSHRLHRVCGNPRRTALVIYAFTALLAGLGVVTTGLPQPAALGLVGVVVVLLLIFGRWLARVPYA